MRPRHLLGPAVLWLLGSAGACGESPSPTPTPTPAIAEQAVVGGVLEPGYAAVGAILPVAPTCGAPEEAPPILCTGTLVAPRVVLTAAHCVEDADAPRLLSVVFAPEPARALEARRVRVIHGWLHPEWSAGRNDIGALILAEDAPVEPMPLLGVALSEDVVGRTPRVVGYGADDEGRTGRRRSGTVRVTALEAGTFSVEAAPGMSCGGDSGGPVLLEVEGVERLVGVTSFGDLACTTGVNTRVDVHAAFIQGVLDEAERMRPPRPVDPEEDACAARCEGHADCPLGMACVSRPGGGRSCAVAGLEAGRFGEVCTGPEGERLCVKAGEACRQWLPCEEPEVSATGCGVVRTSGAKAGGAGMLAALLALAAWLRRTPSPSGRGLG